MVEAAIYLADPMFMEEKLVNYPHSFWLAVIADDLMTAFLVYMESGPEPLIIGCHVVADARLVPLLA